MTRSLLLASLFSGILVGSSPAQETFLGKRADEWVRQLRESSDANQRRNAAFALGKMGAGAAPALPGMKASLGLEKDTRIREAILFALGDICRHKGVESGRDFEPLFIEALQDPDPLVRRSGAYALGCLGSTAGASRAALEAAFDDPSNKKNPEVRQNIVWALGKLGSKMEKQSAAVLPALQKGLRDNDSLVKRDAASSLLQISDGNAVYKLVKDLYPLCGDSNSEVRRAALNVLVRVVGPADKDAIPILKWAMEDKDVENQRNAALTLTKIGGPETAAGLPILLKATRAGDLDLRRQAVMGIRNIGPAAKEAVEELTELLRQDPDDEVRRNAALALGGIGKYSEPAVPLLLEKIQNPDEKLDTRIKCAMALQDIGPVPAAVKIVPPLLLVLVNDNQDIRVRERVMWSLRVHHPNLKNLPGPFESFQQVLKQPRNGSNHMLRYDCAYMLAMGWRQDAPPAALDVLDEFLRDKSIDLFDKVVSDVGGTGNEFKGGKATVKENYSGDGRVMAADALKMIGARRYSQHPGVMQQLRILAADQKIDAQLRQKAEGLLKAVP